MKFLPLLVLRGIQVLVAPSGADLIRADAVSPSAPPQQVRVVGPAILQSGTRNLIYVEGTTDGKSWKSVDPDQLSVRVTGAGRLLADPAGKLTNPFEVRCDDTDRGKLTIAIQTAGSTRLSVRFSRARRNGPGRKSTVSTGTRTLLKTTDRF